MNPSIHFDGHVWRCVLRCTDYAMPDGVTVRSARATPGESRTENAMVIFDPTSWRPIEIYKMREEDDLDRAASRSLGYEDIRIFRTDSGSLQGLAAALHLRRDDLGKQIPEQVVLSFDERYDIIDAKPIRGAWSASPQKNWVPFDHCETPRFLYSIDNAVLFDTHGELSARDSRVSPSKRAQRFHEAEGWVIRTARERADQVEYERTRAANEREIPRAAPKPRPAQKPVNADVVGYEGLRGGTQLLRVDDDAWLGIGHAMKFVENLKYYWHAWYLVDSRGKTKAASVPMKFASNGIEFAAGMAIDGERVVVSFGVDDMECRLAETKLSAVLELLLPINGE